MMKPLFLIFVVLISINGNISVPEEMPNHVSNSELWKSQAERPFLKKCDIEILKEVEKDLKNLTSDQLVNFLSTFDESCNNNVEFAEWSNELLFQVVAKYPKQTIEIAKISKDINFKAILIELESPVNDMLEPQQLKEKILAVDIQSEYKNRIIKALNVAISK